MTNVLINDTSMTSIGNAIRSKLGVETTYLPSEMASAIQSIPSGGAASDTMVERTATSITNSTASVVGQYAFGYYYDLQSVSLTNVSELKMYAFLGSSSLENADIPNLSVVGGQAFNGCKKLQSISMPNATTIGAYAFRDCSVLTQVVVGTNKSTVCTGSNNMFYGTQIASGNGYIYVPDNLVSQYKSASGWSTYASQIKGISEIS